MADQEIPNTGGDAIKNVDPSQWKQTSNCPVWQELGTYSQQYTQEYS